MKKNTISILFIFTILFGFTSCATDPLLRSHIIGVWRPVKVGSIDIQKLLQRNDTLPPQFTQEDYKMLTELKQSLSKPNPDGTVQRSAEADFSLLTNEATTSYTFRKDNIGARLNPQLSMQGIWKLKKKGTKLILTDVKTKEQFVLLIDSLSSDKMVATNKYLPGGTKITYLKDSPPEKDDGTPF